MPPHCTVHMIYESSWQLNKRPQPPPTGRQTQRREEREGGRETETKRGEHYCGENAEQGKFLMLSLFCNFSETDKWWVCAPITGHKSCNACFEAHTHTHTALGLLFCRQTVFYRCVWVQIDGSYTVSSGDRKKTHNLLKCMCSMEEWEFSVRDGGTNNSRESFNKEHNELYTPWCTQENNMHF